MEEPYDSQTPRLDEHEANNRVHQNLYQEPMTL